jgi:hypothetical protein
VPLRTLPAVGRRRSDRFQPPVTGTPFSLSPEAHGGSVVGAGLLPVRAYVQTPDGLFRVDGVAVSRTPDAVLVRWERGDGLTLDAWVWRAAVKHRKAPTRVSE